MALINSVKKYLPSKRKIIQLFSALIYNLNIKGFLDGKIYKGPIKNLCVPGLNCYSCPGAIASCPIGSLQNALANTNKRIGFYVIGIILLYGVIFGRTICGYLCPFGLLQEVLYKIPTYKIEKNKITKKLTYIKYIMLIVFVFFITMYFGIIKNIPYPAFCKYICPAGTFEGAMMLFPTHKEFIPSLTIIFLRKFLIMLFIIILCVICYRSFCRFLCPLGAIYSLFNKISIVGIKVDLDLCDNCNACVKKCKMDIKSVGDRECINCGECIKVCHKNAIRMGV